MPSYEDSGWKNYRKDDNDPYEHDDWDIGEQIRSTVAASTDWINDMIASVRGEVTGQVENVRHSVGVKSPEELRAEAERRARKQDELQARTRKREEIKSRVGRVSGWSDFGHGLLQCVGGFFTGLFGVLTLIGLVQCISWNWAGEDVAVTLFFFILAFIAGMITNYSTKKRRQLKRFGRYIQMIHDKLYINVDDFVNSLGYSRKTVLKDLRKMIELRVLKQGHIDSEGKYLMLTDETYSQYLQAQESYKSRMRREGNPFEKTGEQKAAFELERLKKKQEQKAAARAEEKAREEEILSGIEARRKEELSKTLTQGRTYIKEIREANDEIPGEEISAKLDRLETVAGQIFTIVEEHPEKLSEIHKFMEYYLPTTLKLVRSYHEFDMQPVQGENITKAKKEIEDTLDMINMAFENLSDRLYQDVAMEVSADISVLQTLLAQEGLKEKDFVLK